MSVIYYLSAKNICRFALEKKFLKLVSKGGEIMVTVKSRKTSFLLLALPLVFAVSHGMNGKYSKTMYLSGNL